MRFPFFAFALAALAPGAAVAQRAPCPGADPGLSLPPGFCATVFADRIGHARHLAVAPNGVVYVNSWSGRIYGGDKPPAGGTSTSGTGSSSGSGSNDPGKYGLGVSGSFAVIGYKSDRKPGYNGIGDVVQAIINTAGTLSSNAGGTSNAVTVTAANDTYIGAIAGGVATSVPLSNWFLIVVSFGSLLVVTGKRSGEKQLLAEDHAEADAVRQTLGLYTPSFLRTVRTLSAAVAVSAYCLWAFERSGQVHPGHDPIWFELTIVPFVIALLHVLRLLDLGQGAAPEELALRDHRLQAYGVAWVALFAIGVYAG